MEVVTVTLRRIGPGDVRAMIINRQGWDPGTLDPENIRPLSAEALARPLFARIKFRRFGTSPLPPWPCIPLIPHPRGGHG